MTNWINYHHLFYFKVIAEEGTVSAAAEKLRLGQPTLSAQLKQFEDQLGLKLFDRQNKKLILTEQGRVTLDYARNIFKMGAEMLEVLHDRNKPAKPALHIAAPDNVPKQVVGQMVKHALRLAPCQITLSEGRLTDLLIELKAHRVDLLVSNSRPIGPEASGIFTRLIAKTDVAFYGTPKFKALRKDFPKSIADIPVILPTHDSRLRLDIESWATANNLTLNVAVESQDISVKKLLAINEVGIIPAATHAVMGQVLRGELLQIGKVDGVQEELYLLTAHRKIENRIASQLKDDFVI